MRVVEFRPRFLGESQMREIIELWHLSAFKIEVSERYSWVLEHFCEKYPEVGRGAAYKDLYTLANWNFS